MKSSTFELGKRRLHRQVVLWKLPKQLLDNILLSTFYTGLFLLLRKKKLGGTAPPLATALLFEIQIQTETRPRLKAAQSSGGILNVSVLVFNEINANKVIFISLLSLLSFSETATLIDLKETISRLFKKLSSPTLFLAVDWFTINIWFLSRGNKDIFRKRRLESNRTEEDPVRALLQSGIEVRLTSYCLLC